MTAPTPHPPTEARLRRRQDAQDAWDVVVRCEVILAGLAVLAALIVVVAQPGELGGALAIVGLGWAVHALLTVSVGYAVGVVVTRRLPPRPAGGTAGTAYAVAGGATAALLVLLGGMGLAAVAWAVLGAVTAGSARVWADTSIRSRALRREAAALAGPAVPTGSPWPTTAGTPQPHPGDPGAPGRP